MFDRLMGDEDFAVVIVLRFLLDLPKQAMQDGSCDATG